MHAVEEQRDSFQTMEDACLSLRTAGRAAGRDRGTACMPRHAYHGRAPSRKGWRMGCMRSSLLWRAERQDVMEGWDACSSMRTAGERQDVTDGQDACSSMHIAGGRQEGLQ
jgi:hypothetical protein